MINELHDYSRLLSLWSYILVFILGCYVGKIYACGDIETPPPIEIKVPVI
jgi:hypothetical protein